jgi:hypothetical protein
MSVCGLENVLVIEFLYRIDLSSIQFFFTNLIKINEFKNLFNYQNQITISIQHFCIKSNQIIEQLK